VVVFVVTPLSLLPVSSVVLHCRWVPVSERSRSLSLVYSGMFIGSIMGLGLSPSMIGSLGWPSVFYVFGSMGVLWYLAWNKRAASTPSEDPLISREEKVGVNTFVCRRGFLIVEVGCSVMGSRRGLAIQGSVNFLQFPHRSTSWVVGLRKGVWLLSCTGTGVWGGRLFGTEVKLQAARRKRAGLRSSSSSSSSRGNESVLVPL
jgi:MFS family permease